MSGASVIEVMLDWWGDTPAGRKVRFILPDDGGVHPFKHLKYGPKNGQRMALSVALISDDETVTPAPTPEPKPAKERRSWSELPLSQQAAMRCNEPDFKAFLVETFGGDGEVPAECVREYCGVDSRRDIHPDKASGAKWRHMDNSYRHWLQHRSAA